MLVIPPWYIMIEGLGGGVFSNMCKHGHAEEVSHSKKEDGSSGDSCRIEYCFRGIPFCQIGFSRRLAENRNGGCTCTVGCHNIRWWQRRIVVEHVMHLVRWQWIRKLSNYSNVSNSTDFFTWWWRFKHTIEIIRRHEQLKTKLRRDIELRNIFCVLHLLVVVKVFADFFHDETVDVVKDASVVLAFLECVCGEDVSVLVKQVSKPMIGRHTVRIQHPANSTREQSSFTLDFKFEAIVWHQRDVLWCSFLGHCCKCWQELSWQKDAAKVDGGYMWCGVEQRRREEKAFGGDDCGGKLVAAVQCERQDFAHVLASTTCSIYIHSSILFKYYSDIVWEDASKSDPMRPSHPRLFYS